MATGGSFKKPIKSTDRRRQQGPPEIQQMSARRVAAMRGLTGPMGPQSITWNDRRKGGR